MLAASQTNSACRVAELLPIICFQFSFQINIVMNIFVQGTLEVSEVGSMGFEKISLIFTSILLPFTDGDAKLV